MCDCGWSFVNETMTAPPNVPAHGESAHVSRGARQLKIGAVFLVVGILITAVTYGNASASTGGGTYIIAYGPIVFGIISIVRGLANSSR